MAALCFVWRLKGIIVTRRFPTPFRNEQLHRYGKRRKVLCGTEQIPEVTVEKFLMRRTGLFQKDDRMTLTAGDYRSSKSKEELMDAADG